MARFFCLKSKIRIERNHLVLFPSILTLTILEYYPTGAALFGRSALHFSAVVYTCWSEARKNRNGIVYSLNCSYRGDIFS